MSPDSHFHLVDGYVSTLSLTTTRLSEKQESLSYCYVGRRKSANCWYSARVCGRSKGSVEGKFEGTFKESNIRSVLQRTVPLHSKVDIIPWSWSMKKWWILHEKHRLFRKPRPSKKPWYLAWGNKTGFEPDLQYKNKTKLVLDRSARWGGHW